MKFNADLLFNVCSNSAGIKVQKYLVGMDQKDHVKKDIFALKIAAENAFKKSAAILVHKC